MKRLASFWTEQACYDWIDAHPHCYLNVIVEKDIHTARWWVYDMDAAGDIVFTNH